MLATVLAVRSQPKESAMKPVCLMLLPVLALGISTMDASAQAWPGKPLTAVVPVGAGSTTDIIPRIVFEQLSSQLGQNVIVENRAGAGTTIGAAYVAKSAPDGYTMLVNSSAHAISPSLYPNLSYHPARDFAAVIPLGISANVLVVSPARGWKTVADFVAAARAVTRKRTAVHERSAVLSRGAHDNGHAQF
jgi:tripartite-type tricarboxylate transporter receptor subunit TctC